MRHLGRVGVELLDLDRGLGHRLGLGPGGGSARARPRARGSGTQLAALDATLHRSQRDVAAQLLAVEVDHVGCSIGGARGRRPRRRPSAVTLSTRPPAVTNSPAARPRGAGVGDEHVGRHALQAA